MTTIVVSCGIGNIGAIPSMLNRIGEHCVIAESAEQIRLGTKIILPGVGSFNAAMRRLREANLIDLLDEMVRHEKIPILGICLGMQLMAEESEEGEKENKEAGFGWIKGRCVHFDSGEANGSLRIPQMGWNHVDVQKKFSLFEGLEVDARFYFAHSYYIECDDPNDVLTTTIYGHPFVSAVQCENVMGVQFHPEKSHRYGLRLLENFVRM